MLPTPAPPAPPHLWDKRLTSWCPLSYHLSPHAFSPALRAAQSWRYPLGKAFSFCQCLLLRSGSCHAQTSSAITPAAAWAGHQWWRWREREAAPKADVRIHQRVWWEHLCQQTSHPSSAIYCHVTLGKAPNPTWDIYNFFWENTSERSFPGDISCSSHKDSKYWCSWCSINNGLINEKN